MSNYVKIRSSLLIFACITLALTIKEAIVSPETGIIVVIECLVGIALIFAPNMVKSVLKLEFPTATVYFYWFFLLISIFLGSCLHLMGIIPFWDKILHATSPMLLSVVGYGIAVSSLKNNEIDELPVWLFILFGFAFAGLCGVFWEFWEFSWDYLAGMNLQRYRTYNNVNFVGQEALFDTMGDLFVNTIGASFIAMISSIQAKNDASYFNRYQISRVN